MQFHTSIVTALALCSSLLIPAGPARAQDVEPIGAHAAELALHQNDPLPGSESFQQSDGIRAAAAPMSLDATVAAEPLASGIKTHPSKAVFGYLPYWESAANLRYDLLTHICCFSVGANSNGTISNPRGWPTAAPFNSVIANAHPNGVKVILCVTCMDATVLNTLLNSTTAMDALKANIKAQLLAGDADGVNIDFEASSNSPEWRSKIPSFMSSLTTYLHAQIPGCEVSFAGPAVNWGTWNLPALANACDYIFIMGYDYNGSWSTKTGASAPLTPGQGSSISVTNTIDVQYANIARDKLILGVPYYGNHWTTSTSAAYSTVLAHQGSTRFSSDQVTTYPLLWDSLSQTPWYRWQSGTTWHQVWFDNAQSLGLKYDLADARGLKGIGMWALNYDGTRPELWDLIDSRYGGTYAGIPNFDGDRDVDLEDFASFQRCMSGANVVQRDPACGKALLDGDSDVDSDDLAIFLKCMKGPDGGADATCTQ